MAVMMHHYWQCDPDGTIHVTNMVGGYRGQHHVHTKKGFEHWKALSSGAHIHELKPCQTSCGCGLRPGQIREFDGRVWNSGAFEGKD